MYKIHGDFLFKIPSYAKFVTRDVYPCKYLYIPTCNLKFN